MGWAFLTSQSVRTKQDSDRRKFGASQGENRVFIENSKLYMLINLPVTDVCFSLTQE